MPIESVVSLNFPKRKYTAEILVCSTAAEHILSCHGTVLCTLNFIHWLLEKSKHKGTEKLLKHSKSYLSDCFSAQYSQKMRNFCLHIVILAVFSTASSGSCLVSHAAPKFLEGEISYVRLKFKQSGNQVLSTF